MLHPVAATFVKPEGCAYPSYVELNARYPPLHLLTVLRQGSEIAQAIYCSSPSSTSDHVVGPLFTVKQLGPVRSREW